MAQSPDTSATAYDYDYRLRWSAPNAHTYYVELSTAPTGADRTTFQLPAWRPGRYTLQDYAAGVSHFEAFDENNRPLSWTKTGSHRWEVQHQREVKRIRIAYHYYAKVLDAGSSYRGEDMAYFNPVNMFMHTGDLNLSCRLTVEQLPEDWKVATAMKRESSKVFTTPSYHDFVDSPTVLAKNIHQISFEVDSVPFHAHFVGNWQAGDAGDSVVKEAFTRIATEQAAIFGELPLDRYHHIYLLLPFRIRHAVEHKYSAMYTLPESVAESAESLRGLFGITSHEFFHVWNVKRIRPAAMWPYDYSKEAYTRLHWFTEGVTDYYAHLALARSGLWSEEDLMNHFSNLLTRIENSHGAKVTAPARASFDSWLARSQYANPHHRASYYALGTRVALLMDAHLRARSDGQESFDDVFRFLWENAYKRGEGVPEDGVLTALEHVTGKPMQSLYDELVNQPGPLDYARYLEPAGLRVESQPKEQLKPYEKLGIGEMQERNGRWVIGGLAPNGEAFQAGLAEDDMLLSINGQNTRGQSEAELFQGVKPGEKLTLEVQRWRKSLTIEFTYQGEQVPKTYTLKKLQEDPPALRTWLRSAAQEKAAH